MNVFTFSKKQETPIHISLSEDLASKIEDLNRESVGQRFNAIKCMENEKESPFERRAYAVMALLEMLETLSPDNLKHSNNAPCSLMEQCIFAMKCLDVIVKLSKETDPSEFTKGIIAALLVYGTKEGYTVVDHYKATDLPFNELESAGQNSFLSMLFLKRYEHAEAKASNLTELLNKDRHFQTLQKTFADTLTHLFKQSNNSVKIKELLIKGLLEECGYSHESVSNRAASKAIIKIAITDKTSFNCVCDLLTSRLNSLVDDYEKSSVNKFLAHLDTEKKHKEQSLVNIDRQESFTSQQSSSSLSSLTRSFSFTSSCPVANTFSPTPPSSPASSSVKTGYGSIFSSPQTPSGRKSVTQFKTQPVGNTIK